VGHFPDIGRKRPSTIGEPADVGAARNMYPSSTLYRARTEGESRSLASRLGHVCTCSLTSECSYALCRHCCSALAWCRGSPGWPTPCVRPATWKWINGEFVAGAQCGRATTTLMDSQRVKTPMRVSWTSHACSLLLTLKYQLTDTEFRASDSIFGKDACGLSSIVTMKNAENRS
jgi:hypothetical protein